MRKLLTLILILCTIAAPAQMRGGALYDPGAARKNLSNVDASATPSMTSITLSGKVRAAWADILGDIYASGTVKVGAGTAAAPAYTFSTDPDTGIYSPGANVLGFGVGGADVASLSSTGLSLGTPLSVANGGTGATTAAAGLAALGGASLNGSSTVDFSVNHVKAGDGSAAAPAYTFSSDPDTGMYSPGADAIGFNAGGLERLKVLGGNNEVLLLPNSHGYSTLYTIASSSAAAGIAATTNGQGDTWFFGARKDMFGGDYGTDRFNLLYGTNSFLAVSTGGNVLIGTSTDDGANKLQVNGNIKADKILVSAGTAAAPAHSFSTDPDTGIYSPGADSVSITTGGSERVRVDNYGLNDPELNSWIEAINGFNPKRWGVKIAKANADPAARSEYLYDAVGMTPVTVNFASNTISYGDWKPFCDAINRPVMVNPDGSVAYELDPNDQTKRLDGTASGISSTTHSLNAMAEFKRLWLRTYEDNDYQYIIFSNVQYDENYHANAFTAADGTIRDRMYHAMYEGSNVDSKLRSLATGAMMVNQTAATEITYAEANGAGWHINYKSQRDFITYLLALISKSTNSQAVFGQGNSNSAAYIAPGALKATGRFWGDDATDVGVKVFFIEHFWGNYWKRMSGLLYNDVAHILVKATPPYSLTGVGYTDTGVTPTGANGQYITAGTLTDAGFIPTTAGGSDSTYFADGLYYVTPAAGVFNVALVGGSRGDAGECGSWACALWHGAGVAHASIGASLSFLKP